jgi:hypothetical protein
MDILAALKVEETKLQQQLDTLREAIKIVIRENKTPTGKKKGMLAAAAACFPDASV